MVEGKESIDNADYAGLTLSDTSMFKGKVFLYKADFHESIFDCFADFEDAEFKGEVDFSGAIFKQGASFRNAIFLNNGKDVSFKDAIFQPSENGVRFEGAKFGGYYERRFGDQKIRLYKLDGDNEFGISKEGNKIDEQRIKFSPEKGISGLIPKSIFIQLGLQEHRELINSAFENFTRNPGNISFKNCLFGALSIDSFPEERIKKIVEREEKRIDNFESSDDRSRLAEFEQYNEKKALGRIDERSSANFMKTVCRHLTVDELAQDRVDTRMDVLFKNVDFYNCGAVDFSDSSFINNGNVSFDLVNFSNTGNADFSYASFANNGEVTFFKASFNYCFIVKFDYTLFVNSSRVDFWHSLFLSEHTSFFSISFINGGHVAFLNNYFASRYSSFSHTCFANNGNVSFEGSSIIQINPDSLERVIWVNNGDVDLRIKEFSEKMNLKFYECLFLNSGKVDFSNVRFPEKGSVMFQRCYFAPLYKTQKPYDPAIDFSGVVFHQATFEGGENGWLSELFPEKEKLSVKAIFDKSNVVLPLWIKDSTIPLFTNVFDDGVVVSWKDLTKESASNLTFRLVDFSRSIFDGMTLSYLQLNAPKWLQKDGRSILYEEDLFDALSRNDEGYDDKKRNIESQYTQLKNNLEKSGSYSHAGEFHFGEQEIRRKGFDEWWRWGFSLTNIYRASCGYGERPVRAFLVLLALILFFALSDIAIPLYTSFDPISTNAGFWYTKLTKAFAHVLIPFDKAANIKRISNVNFWYYPLLFIGKILIYLQTTMFVLAVRRRFKR